MNSIIQENLNKNETISSLIRNKRTRLNMTQKELADAIGLPKDRKSVV